MPHPPPLGARDADFDSALRHARRSVELSESRPRYLALLAEIHLLRGAAEEAVPCLQAALVQPQPPRVYGACALALIALGEHEAAEEMASRALEISPALARALRVRGRARLGLGRLHEAREDFRLAVDSGAGPHALMDWARCSLELAAEMGGVDSAFAIGEGLAAAEEAWDGLLHDPQAAPASATLAHLLLRAGQPARAEEIWLALGDADPALPPLDLAACRLWQRDRAGAADLLRRAGDQDPRARRLASLLETDSLPHPERAWPLPPRELLWPPALHPAAGLLPHEGATPWTLPTRRHRISAHVRRCPEPAVTAQWHQAVERAIENAGRGRARRAEAELERLRREVEHTLATMTEDESCGYLAARWVHALSLLTRPASAEEMRLFVLLGYADPELHRRVADELLEESFRPEAGTIRILTRILAHGLVPAAYENGRLHRGLTRLVADGLRIHARLPLDQAHARAKLLEDLVARRPQLAFARLYLARYATRMGDFELAERHLENVEGKAAALPEVLLTRARCAEKLGAVDRALACYRQALAVGGEDQAGVHFRLARLHLHRWRGGQGERTIR